MSRLIDLRQQPGVHTVTWNALNTPTGIYFCRLEAGDFSQVRRLMVVR